MIDDGVVRDDDREDHAFTLYGEKSRFELSGREGGGHNKNRLVEGATRARARSSRSGDEGRERARETTRTV